ncbi:MAG TPA: Gfo/Idh/MocA family oxidoreductase [Gemmataceae bacterium]|nr:Gfo/Idh/MocA family oxidoreductase [Gemmataceae bacterium]
MATHSASRRQFLKGSLAATAAAPLVLSRLSAADPPKTANSRLTLGFIGVGTQNRGHLGHFLGVKEVQVLAVCDVDTKRRDNAQQTVEKKYAEAMKSGQYKGCAAYNDFRELLNRTDIDAVVIATPDHWHAIPVLEACKAKKDIYCEKPMSLTIHEAKSMIEAVRKYERVFQTGSQQRSSNEFRLACELVRSGRIGKIKTVKVDVGSPSRPCNLPEEKLEEGLDWEMWLGQAPLRPYSSVLSPRGVHNHFPDWRQYREYSGGMMTDWGAHHFDIAQWGLGMDESGPVEIIPPDDPKAERGLRYVYANGVEMIHGPIDKTVADFGGVLFIGSDGAIQVNRGKLACKPAEIIKQPIGEKDVRLYKSPGHQRDWLDCVKSRKRPIADVEIGARSVTVCHLGNLAYWNHRKLRWDPAKWQFVDDAEADKWLDRDRRDPWQLPKV